MCRSSKWLYNIVFGFGFGNFHNEDGEEEYTLSSYVKLGGAYVMKCALKKALGLIGYRPETKAVRNYDNVIMFNPNPVTEENETEDEHELVV